MTVADARRVLRTTGIRVFVAVTGLNGEYLLLISRESAYQLIGQTSIGFKLEQSDNILIIRPAENEEEAIKPRRW